MYNITRLQSERKQQNNVEKYGRKIMKNKIANIIFWIIIIAILVFAFNFYKVNNFNEFVRSEMELH